MGQDSEEAAEFVVTVRNDHVKMKEWYTISQSPATEALKEKYGPYPSLWKEVLNWPGWKEARKEYLRAEQLKDSGGAEPQPSGSNGDNGGDQPRKRKSRWGNASEGGVPPAPEMPLKRFAPTLSLPPQPMPNQPPRVVLPSVTTINPNLTPQQQQDLKNMQAKLRSVNERLDNLDKEAALVDALPRGHRERSPSPPPIYGADGKRKNTRAVRWRERYTAERQDLLEGIMRLSSKGSGLPSLGGLPAGAANLLVRKRVKKIRIPIEEHPNYNFIGLIIGPRGKTQKELESKTGCKIAIRGRGSVKEGARGRRDGKVLEGDNEPLHVVISGDDQRAVDAASDMVEQMLVVIDDEKNVHKQQQLRELALLNGTLKEEDVFCSVCAEKGHRSFECPKRFANKPGVGGVVVKCAICGDASHPTRDCTLKTCIKVEDDGAPVSGGDQQQMDSEYLSFMAELDGGKAEPKKSPMVKAEAPAHSVAPASILPPPPPPIMNLPPLPLPGILPPPPTGGLPQPPDVSPPNNFNPQHRPPQHQPPTHNHGHYGNSDRRQPSQQHRPGLGYGGGHYNQQHQQYGHDGGVGYGQQQQGYGQQQENYVQQQQQPPPPQQPPQVNPGDETAAWDPNSYYGNYEGSGGAGGFNWWEQ